MLKVVDPTSFEDLQYCVEMYLLHNIGGFLQGSYKASMLHLQREMQAGAKCRLVKEDANILAFILYKIRPLEFTDMKVVQQTFFCSSTTPIKAVKCVRLLHEDMYEYGSRKRCDLALTSASHEDVTFQLCRILEKDGWSSQGYLDKKIIEGK